MAWYDEFYDTVGPAVSRAFEWMEENPTATGAIAGAASAGLDYLSEKEKNKLYQNRLEQEARFNERRPSSGGDQYASHAQNITGGTGLLQRGQLT